jgi:NADH dehydrogenase
MPGRVFVTGGSGFVGSAVIDELLSRNYTVNALSHRRSIKSEGDAVRTVPGGLFDAAALGEGMRGCEAVIHLVGIIMEKPRHGITFQRIHVEGTRSVVDAAVRNGIKRYVHMSALGTRPGAVSTYHRTKFAAEQYVRESGLEWTIVRPSFIHGPRGEFMQMEAKWARFSAPPFLFMPYFGAGLMGFGGAGRLQPVYVKDVARAFVDALANRKTIGEVYLLGGSEKVTWPQLHRIASTAITGRPRRSFPIPAWSAKIQAALLPNALLGFNRDQVIMSQEDNTCDITKFVDDFGWTPQPFEPTLKSYASQL